MRPHLITALAMCSLLAAACATSETDASPSLDDGAGSESATAAIISNAGTEIGEVKLAAAPSGVLVSVSIQPGGLTAGWHGIHFHETGDCSDTATFERSGGHIQLVEAPHGLLHPHGPDNGDLPNLSVAGDGSASAEFVSTRISLSQLQDVNGSALVIHAGPDDHYTQPIGGAGDRRACAVIHD